MADNTNDKSGKKIDYDFAAHERPLFEAWMNAGYFQRTPELGAGKGQPYTIVIPPPNITGVLHMGHALNDTIQDTCIRRARMQGRPTRWILGTDHAGISTQTKVDKKLADQGISRLEIGREAFIEACYDWYKEYGTTIVNQIKGMGCSCDYEDEHFTLEPAYVKAVRKLFVDWYHDDLIYKGKRIVNWCPHCTTSISDDEAEYVDETGHLWHLRYPLTEPVDGLEYLVVATTRPETMLGDTGVAVNPTTGYTREKAAALVNEMSAAYGLDIAAAPEDMDIIYADAAHDYAGSGYNVPDAKTRGAVELLARTEGIFLDPCYTAKSFRGFCDIARELDGGAIFVHTGGTPALWTQEHLDAFAADYWN